MKLWVTGCDGLLGSTLKKHASLFTNRKSVDIADRESLKAFTAKNRGITHIINCAAFSLVDLAETKREEAFEANAVGPENLGLIAKEIGARIIHISTDYVFPGNLPRPLKEEDPVQPLSYYGFTKLEGELRLQKVNKEACIIRTSWIFGRGGKNFVAKLLLMLQEHQEIRLTNDHWNCPTYVEDLSNIILQMLDASGTYHFANRGAANKYEFGRAMHEIALGFGFSLKTKKILPAPGSAFPSPAVRPVYSAFDLSKIENFLGLKIRPWRDALSDYLKEAKHAGS